MAYYVDLTIDHGLEDDEIEEFIDIYLKNFEHGFDEEELNSLLIHGNCENVRWNETEKEMKFMSKMFPGHLFTLTGKGEGEDDMWQHHFKDGKEQFCGVVIEYEPIEDDRWVD